MTTTTYNKKNIIFSPATSFQNQDTLIEVSTAAINNNIAVFKNHIGAHNSLALVIKGNGYGHGLIPIGLLCEQNTFVDWVCVAHYSEALALIGAGITKNILVLGYAHPHILHPLPPTIHFMVDNLKYAQHLNNIGKTHHQRIAIHIKIDTGLSRFGVAPHSLNNLIQNIKKLPYIRIEGIFSHFVASDSNPELTKDQLTLFSHTIESALSLMPYVAHIHMSNTASTTTLEYPGYCNFFRIGLGLYGFSSDTTLQLKPAMTWKTHIISIKTIPAHSYVSYACTYKTERITRVALLPVGYSDGYQLRFSNKTSVLINNARAPVIGRVGMNVTLVDVTDCNATIGDETILIGGNPDAQVTDLARAADIFNVREIFTGINPSIERLIVE